MNRRQALNLATRELSEAHITDAAIDARLLLEWAADLTLTDYALYPEEELSRQQEEKLQEGLEKRKQRIPLQHITGQQEFMGIPFKVDERVLVPRQDTELLVEEALRYTEKGMHVLDLCTGSGCIIVSLCKIAWAKGKADAASAFTGSDLSEDALEIARENARQTETEVSFVQSDLFDKVDGPFDLILSNPPYIPAAVIDTLEKEVKDYDPRMALDGGEDGLFFYRKIIRDGFGYLKEGGRLLLEIGWDQGEAVTELMKKEGYEDIYTKRDLAGNMRIAAGQRPIPDERLIEGGNRNV